MKMHHTGTKTFGTILLFAMLLLLPFASNAAVSDTGMLQLKASNFKFEPSTINIPKPGPITLQVENMSDHEHNITVKNPEGRIISSVNLPSKKTTPVQLDLSKPGNYSFYCDKPLHETMGMKGEFKVGGNP